jgi:hypothetical protein
MKLLSSYAPQSFTLPCVVFSTLAHETAICFVESMNATTAIRDVSGAETDAKSTDFITIKKHKTPEDAVKFHSKIAMTYRNGESDELWKKGMKPFMKLLDTHKKQIKKAGIKI